MSVVVGLDLGTIGARARAVDEAGNVVTQRDAKITNSGRYLAS